MSESTPGDEGHNVGLYDASFGQTDYYSVNPQPVYQQAQYSAHPAQYGSFSGTGPVYADNYSSEPYMTSPQQHGYINEYGQFIPFHQPTYHNQQHYNGTGSGGQRGGRGKRGGRGRGRAPFSHRENGEHYYGNRQDYFTEDVTFRTETEGTGVRPKQFSYQGNRYRHDRQNRKKSTDQPNNDTNQQGTREATTTYVHKQRKNQDERDLSELVQNDRDAFDPESSKEGERRKDTHTNRSGKYDRGYSSQRRQKNMDDNSGARPRSGQFSRYGKARGGYTSGKKNSVENSRTVDKDYERVEVQEPDRDRKMGPSRGRGSASSYKGATENGGNEDFSPEESQKRATDKQKTLSADRTKRGRKFVFKGDQDDETQRGCLIEQLSSGMYECMVCFDVVRRDAAIWGCSNCYHVFHLRCIKKWARSPTSAAAAGQEGWRCPACQNLSPQVPNQYRCFCGKVRDPDNSRYDTPHSCGEVCGKSRNKDCPHPCNILCHPGPCPMCQATITKHCSCGHFKMSVKCGQAPVIKCQEVCGKARNCGRHDCDVICHEGQCHPCEEKLTQVCYCTAQDREVVCGSAESFASSFSCQGTCKRRLECGEHLCEVTCHPGPCDPCKLSPYRVRFCPCLKTPLSELSSEERQKCTDPIPTCQQNCDKELLCGPPDSPHRCVSMCHVADCPECTGDSEICCQCGALSKTVPCRDLAQYTGEKQFSCDKRCNKKRDCGRHRCTQLCCVDAEHKCDLICGKKLSCGLHRCQELCHRGNCHTCWNVSFDELRCHCGNEVLYPPVACGTRPPECNRKCTRMHSCEHEVLHKCHSEENCPPCTQLTEKQCLGKHEYRRNIPCHITEVSCGLKCQKPLTCGHKCALTCHKGECVSEEQTCSQPCSAPRADCGHMCRAPCHSGQPCPVESQCREEVTLKCECGNRSDKVLCHLLTEEKSVQDYQRMATSMLAMRMGDARDGQSVDISSLMQQKDKQARPKKLACNSDCAVKERNRRLALALEIKNPEQASKPGPPNYTDFLKDYTKKNLHFVSGIEKALGELVLTAQKSAQRSRSHAFSPMNRDQRRVIHELAEFYGCSTQSYDDEPKKNVAATASKDKCWRPSVTLTALVQRDLHPKAPVPIPHRSSEEQIRTTVQASKQSTQLVGGGAKMSSNAWNSKSSKPLNSWTTLKPAAKSVSSTERNEEQDNSPAARSLSTTHLTTQVKPAWGRAAPTKKEPLIDYFEMTD